jgi:hypothetical protein
MLLHSDEDELVYSIDLFEQFITLWLLTVTRLSLFSFSADFSTFC